MRGAATHRALGRWRSGSLDQAVKLSTCRSAFGRIAEQPVLSSDDEGPDRTLGSVLVDCQVAFLDDRLSLFQLLAK